MFDVLRTAGWTSDQWIMFACFTVAGLAGLGLVAMELRRFRIRRAEALAGLGAQPLTEALMREHLEASRTRVPLPAGAIVRYEPSVIITATDHTEPVFVQAAEQVAEIEAHIAPGPGSLATLAEVGEGSLLAAEPSVDPLVSRWFDEALSPALYAFDAALTQAMATVRAWQAIDPIADARHTLDEWRADTPTGEWPIYVSPDRQREVAEVLLIAM